MMPLYTKLNVQQYIDKIDRQKEVLLQSTICNASELKQLCETYDNQISIATKILIRLNTQSIDEMDVKDAINL